MYSRRRRRFVSHISLCAGLLRGVQEKEYLYKHMFSLYVQSVFRDRICNGSARVAQKCKKGFEVVDRKGGRGWKKE